jgi:hypothetical protein
MFEIAGVSEEVAKEALRLAGHKLPVRVKIIKRDETLAKGPVTLGKKKNNMVVEPVAAPAATDETADDSLTTESKNDTMKEGEK